MNHEYYLLEEFVSVAADMQRVAAVMTDRQLMQRWMSGAVRFVPLDGWRFDQGARWRMTLSGLGRLLEAQYVVYERQPGLILWSFEGFWSGFDAWHWLPHGSDSTLIQNRIEYQLNIAGLDLIWPVSIGPLMQWDAKGQMQRLKQVCEQHSV